MPQHHLARHPLKLLVRTLVARTLKTLAVAAIGVMTSVHANETQLPNIGSSAGQVASPEEQRQYGFYVLHELRNQNGVLDDELLADYLNTLGYRLVSFSPKPDQPFTFFLVRDTEINAFALPGGFVGVNAGLITTTESEDDLAAVLAHEISHVTQNHMIRAVEAEQKMTPLMLLAMVGAIAASAHQSPNSTSNSDIGAIAAVQGLAIQMQINFTRADEAEADRVGIQTLAKANFDPDAMATFFGRMQRALRPGFDEGDVPALLMDHPVTIERISEAKARAESAKKDIKSRDAALSTSAAQPPAFATSLLLPSMHSQNNGALLSGLDHPLENRDAQRARAHAYYELMRERVRVLVNRHPADAVGYYVSNLHDSAGFDTPATRYGHALALIRAGRPNEALEPLRKLSAAQPDNLVFQIGLGEAELYSGMRDAALQRYTRLDKDFPTNRALAIAQAQALLHDNDKVAAKRAQELLRPQLAKDDEDPDLQVTFARACELAGDAIRAGEAHATAAYLNGRAEDALNQLKQIAKRSDLDYYQRTRVEALIEQMTPVVLELRRRNIKPADQGKLGAEFSVCLANGCK